MRRFRFLSYIALTIIFCSCTEMLYTSLDVLRPSKVSFDKSATRLLVINNSIVQPPYWGHSYVALNGKKRVINHQTDSIAMFCIASFAEEIDSKAFFNLTKYNTESINANIIFAQVSLPDSAALQKLFKKYNANVIISLDKIEVNDEISEAYMNNRNTFMAAFDVRYQTNWSIHYSNGKKSSRFSFNDTIYWESESYYKIDTKSLPERKNGIIDGALYVGKKTAERVIPTWDKVDRYFYNTKNKYMKMGMDSVYYKNWDAAILNWSKAFESGNSTTKAFAANNMAIGYEITGDIDKAIEFASKAYEQLSNKTIVKAELLEKQYQYLEELWKRKRELKLLKDQLGE